jgi:hypothetical protein
VTPDEMARWLERRARRAPAVVARAIQQRARPADDTASRLTPRQTGAARRGWVTRKIATGYSLINTRDRARWVLGGALIAIGRRAAIDTIDRRAIARYIKDKG